MGKISVPKSVPTVCPFSPHRHHQAVNKAFNSLLSCKHPPLTGDRSRVDSKARSQGQLIDTQPQQVSCPHLEMPAYLCRRHDLPAVDTNLKGFTNTGAGMNHNFQIAIDLPERGDRKAQRVNGCPLRLCHRFVAEGVPLVSANLGDSLSYSAEFLVDG
jgi:hypothetical protein